MDSFYNNPKKLFLKNVHQIFLENVTEIYQNKIPMLKSLLCMSIQNLHMRGFIVKKIAVNFLLFAHET